MLLSLFALAVYAVEPATELSDETLVVEQDGVPRYAELFSGKVGRYSIAADQSWMKLTSPEGIGSMYIEFLADYGTYTVTDEDSGETVELGKDGFIHAFLDMQECFGRAPETVTIRFISGRIAIRTLRVFSPGEVPEDIQRWTQAEEGRTDLLLLSAHGDDEQLFFAGILPYYAGQLGYQVQVLFLTNHYNIDPYRIHEMLDALWAVGVRTYPIFGPFPDFNTRSLSNAYEVYRKYGCSRDDLTSFVVEQMRRYKPLVAVSHDTEGEYGHGQHRVCAQLLMDAAECCGDKDAYPESAEKYGTWDVPKTYIHLYPENPVEMDWDLPLPRFGGMTAYQVSRDLGFAKYKSQYRSFAWYFEGASTASAVKKFNPCFYGLYRTTVGEDAEKNDFFENLQSYSEQRVQEEAARLEAELAAEAAVTETAVVETTVPAVEPEPVQQEPAVPEKLPDRIVAAGILAVVCMVCLAVLFAGKQYFQKMRN